MYIKRPCETRDPMQIIIARQTKYNTLCCHGCLEITIAAMTASYTYTQLNNYCTSSST